MDGIEITVDRVGALRDIGLFRVRGYVDTTTSPELQRQLTEIIQEGVTQIIIDLGAVNYVSSAGWGVFVGEIRGLREQGGDLKIIQMIPEVNEVFEMLEFNRILTCYDSLEEAIDDYDFCQGVDLRASMMEQNGRTSAAPLWETDRAVENPADFLPPVVKESRTARTITVARGRTIDDVDLPLNEKIKKLVTENPLMTPFGIKRQLNSPRFGYTRIGFFKLRGILKRLGLETKAKRYRFYRSR
ncbi:MAG TPA: STAS domain-containing protein [bacterium]|nr:STAS domain-containing protein [bacterium]HQG45047.1 STAS domain-containing protein [bacterium]HQI47255.1 STAS domain-containing protein [bacterium]HQJ64236.1 STAS domain-containing protein [bacterium]